MFYHLKKISLPLFAIATLLFNSCEREALLKKKTEIILSCDGTGELTLTDHREGDDYIVECELYFNTGVVRIKEGVNIKFNPGANLVIGPDAALIIEGSAQNKVVLSGSVAGASWGGIRVESDDVRNALNHCIIENAGSIKQFITTVGGSTHEAKSAILAYGRIKFNDVTINGSGGYGIAIGNAGEIVQFEQCNINNCVSYPLFFYGANLTPELSFTNSTFTGNNENYIAVYSVSSNKEIETDITVNESPIPYLVYNYWSMIANCVIEKGVHMVFNEGSALSTSYNYIQINGTSASPVKFSGRKAGPGQWLGVYINSNSVNNIFNYLDIADAGSEPFTFEPETANITLGNEARLTLNNCTSSNALGCDIFNNYGTLNNQSPLITNICTK